jgi:hypothetical protein
MQVLRMSVERTVVEILAVGVRHVDGVVCLLGEFGCW